MADSTDLTALERNDEESVLVTTYERVQPYQYEPIRSDVNDIPLSDSDSEHSSAESQSEDENGRVGNTNWCHCGECPQMQTEHESRCCREIDLVDRLREDLDLRCITEHPGYEGNCLNEYVVETSFYEFLDGYGHVGDDEPVHDFRMEIVHHEMDNNYGQISPASGLLPKGPSACPYCGKLCASRWKLARHLRSHTGLRPYSCGICGQAFSSKSSVQRHQANLHSSDVFQGAEVEGSSKFMSELGGNEENV